jgi:Asp-tRNA(Asn)/Glu-tRNA(Gln) amidotransferase A subunit family amidase
MDQTCARLWERGAEVVEVALPAGFGEVIDRHRIVMAVEGAAYHRERLRHHPEDYGPCIRGLLEEGLVGKSPEGLPLGLQLVGPPWGEGSLFAAAAWCEDALEVNLGEPSV